MCACAPYHDQRLKLKRLVVGKSHLEVLPNTLLHYENYLSFEQSTIAMFSAAMEPATPSSGGGGGLPYLPLL